MRNINAKKIGITERGDAGRDLSWYDKMLIDDTVEGAVIITKNIDSADFRSKLLDMHKNGKPCILHATVTGWGFSPMEPRVATTETAIDHIRKVIDDGFPADRIVLRVDPIIPTPEGMQKAYSVITRANITIPDVKRIRISVYDDYHGARDEMIARGYAPIDTFGKWKNEQERRPSRTAIQSIIKMLIQTNNVGTRVFECCAEPELAKAHPSIFVEQGCVSEQDYLLMGLVPPLSLPNKYARFGCKCLSTKKELLTEKKPCPNNCAYCYWR